MVNVSEKLEVYKCSICGNIVEVLNAGGGELVCCEQPMNKLSENTTDAATEKHVPIIVETETGIKITVGEVLHPMAEEHYIQWIQAISGGKSYRKFLNPGDAPEAEFNLKAEDVTAREYCNLHGLWKA